MSPLPPPPHRLQVQLMRAHPVSPCHPAPHRRGYARYQQAPPQSLPHHAVIAMQPRHRHHLGSLGPSRTRRSCTPTVHKHTQSLLSEHPWRSGCGGREGGHVSYPSVCRRRPWCNLSTMTVAAGFPSSSSMWLPSQSVISYCSPNPTAPWQTSVSISMLPCRTIPPIPVVLITPSPAQSMVTSPLHSQSQWQSQWQSQPQEFSQRCPWRCSCVWDFVVTPPGARAG